jgi:DNA repair protein RecO (recombination protein O)
MVQELLCTEGMILRAASFRDYDQILTLFTPDRGILKLFCKGNKKKRRLQGAYMPLTRVEVVYKEKNSDLFACEDVALLQSYHSLRENLPALQAACDFLQALYQSQVVGKEAPQLYNLLTFYLDKLNQIPDPWILALSFRLKILKHEGLLSFTPLMETMPFDDEELQLLQLLTLCKSYIQLTQVILPSGFAAKVNLLFNQEIYR